MRQIIFKGKTEQGKWQFGYLIRFEALGSCIIWSVDFGKVVIEETVGQYTGLNDKNGKMIFEGDIVKHYNKLSFDDFESYSVLLVYWDSESGRFRGKDIRTGNLYGVAKECCYEVIGNLHDNPELLKGE